MNYWIIKSEPFKYSWETFTKEKRTFWDGVRNYQARNNLRAMKEGDLALFYHSNEGKEFVGVAKVVKEAYPDPTADSHQWVCVDVIPVSNFPTPVTLAAVKLEEKLENLSLLRQPRLSVAPVLPAEFDLILAMSGLTPENISEYSVST